MTREDESEVAGQCDKCHTPYGQVAWTGSVTMSLDSNLTVVTEMLAHIPWLSGRDSASTVLVRIICVRTPGRVVLAMKLAVLVRTRLALACCSTIEQRA